MQKQSIIYFCILLFFYSLFYSFFCSYSFKPDCYCPSTFLSLLLKPDLLAGELSLLLLFGEPNILVGDRLASLFTGDSFESTGLPASLFVVVVISGRIGLSLLFILFSCGFSDYETFRAYS
jgi:hypothetical protein